MNVFYKIENVGRFVLLYFFNKSNVLSGILLQRLKKHINMTLKRKAKEDFKYLNGFKGE